MCTIRIITNINAPIERCFDLARDIDFHTFRSPFGPIGWLVDFVFMTGYLRRLLEGRA